MDSNYKKIIGQNIRRYRKLRCMSQEALAKAVGVHFNTISNYETGSRKCDLEVLLNIAKILEISPGHLLQGAYHLTQKSPSMAFAEGMKGLLYDRIMEDIHRTLQQRRPDPRSRSSSDKQLLRDARMQDPLARFRELDAVKRSKEASRRMLYERVSPLPLGGL